MLDRLADGGVQISSHLSNINVVTTSDGDLKRIISVIYGMLENGNPFWLFAAVRPEMYQLFLTTQKAGQLDLYNFDPFGEILVSGEGRAPPDEVTLKVAEMYQTDPHSLMQAMHEEDLT
jgi:hypothetical protein